MIRKRQSTQVQKSVFLLTLLASLGFLNSCSTSTESGAIGVDRKQFLLLPSSYVNSSSVQAYTATKQEAEAGRVLNQNPQMLARIRGIANKIIPQTVHFRNDAPHWSWEVNVISRDELNAYCMPGGKIMFYTGIVEKLKLTDAEIAAVMGHEIAHALREHGRERMSQALATQVPLVIASLAAARSGVDQQTLQLGAQFYSATADLGFLRPHGRNQESEADDIGLELMARAGFDPSEAVTLWKKMGAASGGKVPEFLSTHPSDTTRIRRIESLLPKVQPLFKRAQ